MTSEQLNDGGPAFPVPNDAAVNRQEGMSLRDWFAGQAMASSNSRPNADYGTFGRLAEESYKIADEMLKARSQ